MIVKVAILIAYFLLVLGIGFVARTRWKSTPENYFLADRQFGTLILLGTMVATNFSAFTVFGTSGAGYRDGYAFFPIMGFGTGFMALTFWMIGRRIRRFGQQYGLVTPPELVKTLYQSPALSFIFAVVMIVFTIPYLALQPMAAGYALEELVKIPYTWGCLLVTGIILLYTVRGGLRAVAWTDLFQGLFMFALLAMSLAVVAAHHNGFIQANAEALALNPELFSRPGATGRYTLGIWFSYMMLWFFCDPMFPQLFQRFFAARDDRIIGRTMLLYPLVCTVVFFMPISVGVLGRLSFPGLVGKEADRILPMVLNAVSGDVMSALVIAAGLAALMSTMDSQLLTLSSIFTRDIWPLVRKKQSRSSVTGRLFVAFLSLAGLALAYKPPASILQIATQTFTGLAVLFPTVVFGLYFRRCFASAAMVSIIAGESILIGFYFKWISAGPFLPVVWVMGVTVVSYLIAHAVMLRRAGALSFAMPGWVSDPGVIAMALLFILAMDSWMWGKTRPMIWGVPLWLLYFVGLSGIQTLAMGWMVRRSRIDGGSD